MNATRLCSCVLALLLVTFTGMGCGWSKRITWDLSARENEPRSTIDPNTQQTDADYRDVLNQRARNEAAFRAASPGAKR
jgi:hypothetical protein